MTRPAHTVIYTHGGGRLGNQILRLVHWMAWARAHAGEVEVIDPAFWPYAGFFAHWSGYPGCTFPARASWADGLARAYVALPEWVRAAADRRNRFLRAVQSSGHWRPGWQAVELDVAREESIDLEGSAFMDQVRRRSVTVCSGWRIAGWRLVTEQQEELRPYFQPSPRFAVPAGEFIASLRSRHDLLIGLLIRQSDYRIWEDGRFFFSTECYVRWIRQLLDLFPGRRVAFVVAAEERLDPALWAGLPVFQASGNPEVRGHWFEKWVELSRCDFIAGPPSTFSATAAFLGGIPLWPLAREDQVLAHDQMIPDGMIGAARHPVFSRAVK